MKFFEAEDSGRYVLLQAVSEEAALAVLQAEMPEGVTAGLKEVDDYHVLQRFYEDAAKKKGDYFPTARIDLRRKVREGTALLLIAKK